MKIMKTVSKPKKYMQVLERYFLFGHHWYINEVFHYWNLDMKGEYSLNDLKTKKNKLSKKTAFK